MSLVPGTRLGPYEIVAPIAAGGMGEVYQAMDTRLGRTVAVKVLPDHLSSSRERRARFEREARAISKLSHPHLCPLFDVGETDGTSFLVMEYLQGETLAKRLKRGALPLEQVLAYGAQIAKALDAAHRAGIIHRDLKPGNVVVTKSGVKLVDFGLARWIDGAEVSETSDAPTQERDLTSEQTTLGTPHYMAPEQLEGKSADARTDVHALGAVLYEMATGRKAFEGESRASLVSAILTATPKPPSELSPSSPRELDDIVATALEKNPEDRWQSARDVALLLGRVSTSRDHALSVPGSSRARWVVAGALLAAIVASMGLWRARDRLPPKPGVLRLTVKLPEGFSGSELLPAMALSPGRGVLAIAGRPALGTTDSIFVRSLSEFDGVAVPGTTNGEQPFFSPDGATLGFVDVTQRRAILSTPAGGGIVREVGAFTGLPRGLAWDEDDSIWFGTEFSGLWRVHPASGAPEPVTELRADETGHMFPVILPDGRGLLFTVRREAHLVAHLSRDGGDHRVLFEGTAGAYLDSGHLVYALGTEILAVPFDLDSLLASAPPSVVARDVRVQNFYTYFAAGADGWLAYAVDREVAHKVVWVDRTGLETTALQTGERFHSVRLSPDATLVAVDRGGSSGLWVFDLVRGTRTLIAANPGGIVPRWTPDGSEIVFSLDGDVYTKASDGTGDRRLVLERGRSQLPLSFSPDDQVLAITDFTETSNRDIWLLRSDGELTPFLATEANENAAAISPDGRWIAYQSDESGRDEIYVQPFPGPGRRVLVSTGGGRAPVWARSGGELFYREGTAVMSVPLAEGDDLVAGRPVLLFDGPYQADTTGHPSYDVSPDGQRFLMVRDDGAAVTELNVVLNLGAELERGGSN